jgi:hypothetical protein
MLISALRRRRRFVLGEDISIYFQPGRKRDGKEDEKMEEG